MPMSSDRNTLIHHMPYETSQARQTERLLIADEDQMACELLQYKFQTEGYVVDICHSGAKALSILNSDYNLVLIDLMGSSEMDGFQLASKMRRNPDTFNVPFIFVTKRANEDDIVSGLDAGADDYIPKPFSARELVARVKSVLRRRKMMSKRRMSNIMRFEELEMDLGTGIVKVNGETISLSRTEFLILAMFMRHRNQFFDRAEIRNEAWEEDDNVSERAVDTNISRLRKKLGDYGKNIINRQGHGYGFLE